jgi:sarcosine oxidase subunit beta
MGMVVDTSGVYLHREAGDLILAGYSPEGDPPGWDIPAAGRGFYEEEIWPRLAGRFSAADRTEWAGGWSGLYDMSPDRSALVGAVAGHPGLFEIHSFSGRGVMQGWAAAGALAEQMTGAREREFDAAALTGARFAEGRAEPEELHI